MLNVSQVRKLRKPKERYKDYPVGSPEGSLMLRYHPSGKRVFVGTLDYYIDGTRKQQRRTLGEFEPPEGGGMTLQTARRAMTEAAHRVQDGQPPFEPKRRRSRAKVPKVTRATHPRKGEKDKRLAIIQDAIDAAPRGSFGELVGEYRDRRLAYNKDDGNPTLLIIWRYLSHWWKLPAADLRPADLRPIMDDVVKNGTALIGNNDIARKPAPATALRIFQVVKAIYRFAASLDEGAIKPSPFADMQANIPKGKPRRRYLSQQEIQNLIYACDGLSFRDDESKYSPTGDILQLLLITGARLNEIAAMEWEELNLETGIWTLPAARAKNGVELVLTLPRQARKILDMDSVPRIAGSPYVFTANGTKPFVLDIRIRKRIEDAVGADSHWTPHDLRRTWKTHMAAIGCPPEIRDAVQNHTPPGQDATYLQQEVFRRQAAAWLQRWADCLDAWAGGNFEFGLPRLFDWDDAA